VCGFRFQAEFSFSRENLPSRHVVVQASPLRERIEPLGVWSRTLPRPFQRPRLQLLQVRASARGRSLRTTARLIVAADPARKRHCRSKSLGTWGVKAKQDSKGPRSTIRTTNDFSSYSFSRLFEITVWITFWYCLAQYLAAVLAAVLTVGARKCSDTAAHGPSASDITVPGPPSVQQARAGTEPGRYDHGLFLPTPRSRADSCVGFVIRQNFHFLGRICQAAPS